MLALELLPVATQELLRNLELERMPVEGDVIEVTSDGVYYSPLTKSVTQFDAGDRGNQK